MTDCDRPTDDETGAVGARGILEGETIPAIARVPIAKVRLTLTRVALAMTAVHEEPRWAKAANREAMRFVTPLAL